ncbi:MAG: hypothetical protein JO228_11695 [Xanthobacteraceae bacterium]|nr:hypothetical protein [Xanthobacteraceae bacterium]
MPYALEGGHDVPLLEIKARLHRRAHPEPIGGEGILIRRERSIALVEGRLVDAA